MIDRPELAVFLRRRRESFAARGHRPSTWTAQANAGPSARGGRRTVSYVDRLLRPPRTWVRSCSSYPSDEHRGAIGDHQLGRPELGAFLRRHEGIQSVEARGGLVRPRTRRTQQGRWMGNNQQHGPSRNFTDQSACGLTGSGASERFCGKTAHRCSCSYRHRGNSGQRRATGCDRSDEYSLAR